MKLAIEVINRYETYLINTLEKGMDFVKKVDHPAVGIMADPYSAQGMETQTGLMDQYAKQAIDYIRMTEQSLS